MGTNQGSGSDSEAFESKRRGIDLPAGPPATATCQHVSDLSIFTMARPGNKQAETGPAGHTYHLSPLPRPLALLGLAHGSLLPPTSAFDVHTGVESTDEGGTWDTG